MPELREDAISEPAEPMEFEPIAVLIEDSCGEPEIHDFIDHLWPSFGALPSTHSACEALISPRLQPAVLCQRAPS